MKRIPTIVLRAAIIAIAVGVLSVCIFLLPSLWGDIGPGFPDYAYAVYAVFISMYIAAIPFFFGLYKGWQLLGLIDKGRVFSKMSVRTLRSIMLSAAAVSAVYVLSLPFFYIWGERDDAPGVIVIGMVLAGAPFVVSVFAALLQRLIAEAVELKSENELTV